MTIIDEGRQIRGEVAKLRPDRRRTYSSELKRRILDWVGRAMATGMLRSDCGHVLGIKSWRIKTWQEEPAPGPAEAQPQAQTLALVPIEMPTWASGPTLVTPSGYRVEGLAVEQIAALLRELA
jgi:hypothetical protein